MARSGDGSARPRDSGRCRLRAGLRNIADFPEVTSAILAQGVFGDDSAARTKALAAIDAYLATKPKSLAGAAPGVLLRLNEPARALDLAASAPTENDILFNGDLFSPLGNDARALPQFGDFPRTTGITVFWDRYGPPPAATARETEAMLASEAP